MFAVSQEGCDGTDVPKRYKKGTCPNGQCDGEIGKGLEVMAYKRLHNGVALLRSDFRTRPGISTLATRPEKSDDGALAQGDVPADIEAVNERRATTFSG
jgi:hypothetical protein